MDEITSLKAENERFKAIIDILLQENEQLRTALSYHSSDDRKWEKETSDVAQIDRKDQHALSYHFSDDRKWENKPSDVAQTDGKDQYAPSYHSIDDRKNTVDHSLIVPHLRKEMLRSKMPGLKNAAVLLGQFYNHPQNTHKHLASITRMTMSGLAKHIYMLKKRGLIQRSGFQTYTLTPKAIGIVEKALQVTNG